MCVTIFKKRKIVAMCAIVQIFFLAFEPFIVHAFGMPDIAEETRKAINQFLEDDLNINVKKGLRPQTETINSIDRKGRAPAVSIRFSTPNPKEGEKITASADVENIGNINDAYFIWYLKNPNRIDDETRALVGDDRDGEINMQHVLAVRAQAELYFDPETLDQEMNGGDNDGNFYDEYDNAEKYAGKDDDGYIAPLGGGNAGGDAPTYCYVYDPISGVQRELAKSGNTTSGCPEGYVARCMQSDKSIQCPTIIDDLSGEIHAQAEAGVDGNTGNVETNVSTDADFSGLGGARFRNLWQCVDSGSVPTCINGAYACKTADGDWGKDYKYGHEMSEARVSTPFCVPKNANSGKVWTDPNAPSGGCPEPKMSWCFDGEIWPEDSGYYEQMCGLPYGDLRDNYYGGGCRVWSIADEIKKPGACEVKTSKKNMCDEDVRVFSSLAGDGDFGLFEEKLYHLNPLTDKTTPLAINDEAFVVGVGLKEFTWKYQKGDEIGVIVEGRGIESTKHEDATYQTVFALLDPGCKDVLQDKGSYFEMVRGKQLKINVGSLKDKKSGLKGLNACIQSNNLYVKPGISEYDGLNVSLTVGGNSGGVSTQAVIPSGLGLEKTVTAIAGQIQGGGISQPKDLYYEWDIQCDGESIKENEEFKHNILTKTKGINLKNLKIIANFPDICTKVGKVHFSVKVNEPRSGGGSNFGQSTTAIKIYDIGNNPLKVYSAEFVNESQYKSGTKPICNEGIDKTVCRVMNNEVVAIKAEEFTDGTKVQDGMISWTVDGKNYTCNERISSDCSNESNTNTIILPFTGDDGDLIPVTANMSNVTYDTNQKQQVTRVFRITEPSVMIVPQDDTVKRKILGTYTDIDENSFVNESDSIFEITKGETARLSAVLYPEFLNKEKEGITYEWFVNGTLYSTEKMIEYFVEKDLNITVNVKRELSVDDRLGLNALGITQSQTIPEKFTKTIQLHVTENEVEEENITDVIATVSHNTPIYIIFLLKMVLAIAVMLLIPSLVLGLERK